VEAVLARADQIRAANAEAFSARATAVILGGLAFSLASAFSLLVVPAYELLWRLAHLS